MQLRTTLNLSTSNPLIIHLEIKTISNLERLKKYISYSISWNILRRPSTDVWVKRLRHKFQDIL